MNIKIQLLIPALLIPFLVSTPLKARDYEKSTAHAVKKALPVRTADFFYPQREKDRGPVTFLGVQTSPIDATLTSQLGLPEGMGLIVRRVVPDSPAEKAGLKEHDILRKLDDQILIHPYQLRVLIRTRDEGDHAHFTFLRGGKEMEAEAELIKRLPARYHRGENYDPDFDHGNFQGWRNWMREMPVPSSPNDPDFFKDEPDKPQTEEGK